MNSMEDIIDECLTGKKKKKKKKKLKETIVNVKKILGEEEPTIKLPDDEEVSTTAETTTATEEDEPTKEDQEVDLISMLKKAKKHGLNHETKGDVVLNLVIKVNEHSLGKIEIGSGEYGTLTNLNSLFDMYDLSQKEIIDPALKIDSMEISVSDEISSSDRNTISLMMRLNKDKTLSINVLVNEVGQTFNDLGIAITYFDNQYKTNILDAINKKVRD